MLKLKVETADLHYEIYKKFGEVMSFCKKVFFIFMIFLNKIVLL